MILSQYHFTQCNFLDRLILGNLSTVGLLRTQIRFCKRQMQNELISQADIERYIASKAQTDQRQNERSDKIECDYSGYTIRLCVGCVGMCVYVCVCYVGYTVLASKLKRFQLSYQPCSMAKAAQICSVGTRKCQSEAQQQEQEQKQRITNKEQGTTNKEQN